MQKTVTVGLLGKHPGYGDFLRSGLSDTVAEGLSRWLDTILLALRDETGPDWPAYWDHAQDLRFWVGRAVLGATLAGILRPSRDLVGRRYPFILACEGGAVAPPMVDDHATAVWDGIEEHLDRMRPGEGARALLAGLCVAVAPETDMQRAESPTVWAHHRGGDLSRLLRDVPPVEARHAAIARSYWWAPGGRGRAAVWLGCAGLPNVAELGWLLAGVVGNDGSQANAGNMSPSTSSPTVVVDPRPGDRGEEAPQNA